MVEVNGTEYLEDLEYLESEYEVTYRKKINTNRGVYAVPLEEQNLTEHKVIVLAKNIHEAKDKVRILIQLWDPDLTIVGAKIYGKRHRNDKKKKQNKQVE